MSLNAARWTTVLCVHNFVWNFPVPIPRPKPWYFRVGDYEKEHGMQTMNHNYTIKPPRYKTGKTWAHFHGYLRGVNTSHYFTTVKIWYLKHSLPFWNFTLSWQTETGATHSGERFQNIKQLRRFTPPLNSPNTYVSYEYDTKMTIDYDAITADSWAVKHQKSMSKYLESDHGVYDSSLQNNSFYFDPESKDFGTADYLTKIYTQKDPRELFGTDWDQPG